MFGKNPIRSITSDPDFLSVEDHFYTLQGEGPYSGKPALFIRLAGCNLACHFCDTQFETQADKLRPVHEIFAELKKEYSRKERAFVVITGGEPMRQDFSLLAELLYGAGTSLIQVETAGTLWQPRLRPLLEDGLVTLVCSPKTPKVHPEIALRCNHWKYVVTSGEISPVDGLPIRGTQVATKDKDVIIFRATAAKDEVWVSPCDAYDPEKNRRNVEAAKNSALIFGHRLSLQMHKIVGVE